MITATRIYKRPSTNTPWHFEVLDGLDFSQWLTDNYIQTGKLLDQSSSVLDDIGLVMKFETVWKDQVSLDEYRNDVELQKYWELRDKYNELVGIISEPGQ